MSNSKSEQIEALKVLGDFQDKFIANTEILISELKTSRKDDTDKLLNRPPLVAMSNTSGLAGIAHWINSYFRLREEDGMDKNCGLVKIVKEWVDEQYEEGRVTVITDEELLKIIDENIDDSMREILYK